MASSSTKASMYAGVVAVERGGKRENGAIAVVQAVADMRLGLQALFFCFFVVVVVYYSCVSTTTQWRKSFR